MNASTNREVSMAHLAQMIERTLGEAHAEPYWEAYRRMIYTDRVPISDEQVDRLLAKGSERLTNRP